MTILEIITLVLRFIGLVPVAEAIVARFRKTRAEKQLKEVVEANKANDQISQMSDASLSAITGGVVRIDPEGPDPGKADK